MDDILHLDLVAVLFIQKSEKREQAHLHLLRERETCRMIQSDLAAVSYHTVDKLHLLRM